MLLITQVIMPPIRVSREMSRIYTVAEDIYAAEKYNGAYIVYSRLGNYNDSIVRIIEIKSGALCGTGIGKKAPPCLRMLFKDQSF